MKFRIGELLFDEHRVSRSSTELKLLVFLLSSVKLYGTLCSIIWLVGGVWSLCIPSNVFAEELSSKVSPKIELESVSEGFSLPTYLTYHPSVLKRLLVIEQTGKVMILDDGKRNSDRPFLDLTDRVDCGGEKGLLSIVFHPNKEKPRVYANYTMSTPTLISSTLETIVAEYPLSVDGFPVKSEERILLRIKQPYANHNGGQLAFGPDQKLYIGMGDGGSRMDPHGHGQNTQSLLGKMLRIDVDSQTPYAIPTDNPFADGVKAAKEVWAFGLRNPWRFSFDRVTGTLWAGDVGQDLEEEIDIIQKGKNYGWNLMEGTVCHKLGFQCRAGVFEPALVVYGRAMGGSVTGGYVYRGKAFPALVGWYLYADYLSGRIWGLLFKDGKVEQNEVLLKTDYHISSFGEDAEGELYVLEHQKGVVYRIREGK